MDGLCAGKHQTGSKARTGPLPLRIVGARWEIDFTEVKPHRAGYKYLQVMVDTFSGWTKAFATRNETASMVVKFLLDEIIPLSGLPFAMRSDNGPAFTPFIAQSVSKALNIQWKLHCAYQPQSSGQVECMNRTLKSTLTKLILETESDAPLIRFKTSSSCSSGKYTLMEVHQTGPCHSFCPGDLAYIKKFQKEGLTPAWKGPHTVILNTPTAVKIDGIPAWIHHSRIKKASQTQQATWVSKPGPGPLKL
ncbi:LOW QUALITY PROTEIN: hypothetical protein AAY473_031060 [Plecturocebus cupreus]